MSDSADTRIGQIALARGLVTLPVLLQCMEQSGREGTSLSDVLQSKGLLSDDDLRAIVARLNEGDHAVEDELERGQTIVVGPTSSGVSQWSTLPPEERAERPVKVELELDLGAPHERRYEYASELGRGGMGKVLLARDLVLQRQVAVKSLIEEATSDKARQRLLAEAQVTGLLEHPSIVPVYDLNIRQDGEPFYTMRVVQEQTLSQILANTSPSNEPGPFSLTNLVGILRQVSLALQFAHELGVVHRDIKPENILIGKYGEVYVIDWGVAKVVNENIGLSTTGKMVVGSLVGTPQYMAPEQARGDNDAVDGRSDVYALGAVLYEMLTRQPVFSADHVLAILFQVVHDPPPRPSELDLPWEIPAELEEVCLKALAKDQDRRYQSAQEFADELELFLEGVKERERQSEMAHAAIEQAAQIRSIYEEVRAELSRAVRELNRERRVIESWADPERKGNLWDLQQRAEDLHVDIEKKFGETVRAYGQALVHMPQMPEARRALADLYWERFEEAEASGNRANAAYFEGLVRQYNDGAFDQLLEGTASLHLQTSPPGAQVALYTYQQVRRRLVEWRIAEFEETPVADVQLSHGSHVLEISREGFTPVLVPVLARRAAVHRLSVRLHPEGTVPEGFVVVPAGEFLSGNSDAGELVSKSLTDFAIMRHPVTVREYLEFLNDLVGSDVELARSHAPRVKDGEPYLPQRDDGSFFLPESDPEGDVWDPEWPVLMVNFFDAQAYAEWKSERDGIPLRLPTMDEWEKAARGVDGRVYPWGNHFDPSFCLMRESRRGRATPAPVGSFPIDRSPYGLLDVAGNVAEWTTTREQGSDEALLLGGASFNSIAMLCRLDFNMTSPPQFPFMHYGFRLAMSLPQE